MEHKEKKRKRMPIIKDGKKRDNCCSTAVAVAVTAGLLLSKCGCFYFRTTAMCVVCALVLITFFSFSFSFRYIVYTSPALDPLSLLVSFSFPDVGVCTGSVCDFAFLSSSRDFTFDLSAIITALFSSLLWAKKKESEEKKVREANKKTNTHRK